jgi:hypothetical protein
MRLMIVALIAALVAMGAGTFKSEATDCMIHDSAACTANPKCHWDYERRGCYPGPLTRQNPCAVHEDSKVCETDVSLGCNWNTETNKCESVN